MKLGFVELYHHASKNQSVKPYMVSVKTISCWIKIGFFGIIV